MYFPHIFKKFLSSTFVFFIFNSLFLIPVYGQSPELKSAKQEVIESVDKLAADQENVEARKAALQKVAEFSITETKDFIKKLSAFKNLSPTYIQLQNFLLDSLENLLVFQTEFLKKLEKEGLTLEEIKALAVDFKEWREKVYAAEIKKVLNFTLVFQAGNILKISDARFQNISLDLRRFRNSQVIDVGVLQPILESAGTALSAARSFHTEALAALLNYLPAATSTNSLATTTVSLPFGEGTAEIDIKSLVADIISKVKEAYKKFLLMSQMVDKMIE